MLDDLRVDLAVRIDSSLHPGMKAFLVKPLLEAQFFSKPRGIRTELTL